MRQSEIKKTKIGQRSTSPLRLQLLASLLSTSRNSCNLLVLLYLAAAVMVMFLVGVVDGQSGTIAALGINGTSTVEVTGICEDLFANCTQRGVNGDCESNPVDMLVNCPLTCDSCLPTTQEECVNKGDDDSCFLGAVLGECTANPSYYLRFCSASCSEFLPVCSLQTRDFGEICEDSSRSLSNPDFACGLAVTITSNREARHYPLFEISTVHSRSKEPLVRNEGSQGRGEGSQGRSKGSWVKSEGSQGRGEESQGRGEGSQGRGEGSQGRGEGYQGRGEGSQVKSEGSQVRGERYKTRGEGSEARGEGSQGRGVGSLVRGERSQDRGEGSQVRNETFHASISARSQPQAPTIPSRKAMQRSSKRRPEKSFRNSPEAESYSGETLLQKQLDVIRTAIRQKRKQALKTAKAKKRREKYKQRKNNPGHQWTRIRIPAFLTRPDENTKSNASVTKVPGYTSVEDIHKLHSLETHSTLISTMSEQSKLPYGTQDTEVPFLRQDVPLNTPSNASASTIINTQILPPTTSTVTLSTKTTSITVVGSSSTISVNTAVIPLSSVTETASSSYVAVTICTEYYSSFPGFSQSYYYVTSSTLNLLYSSRIQRGLDEENLDSSLMLYGRYLPDRTPKYTDFIHLTPTFVLPEILLVPTSAVVGEMNAHQLMGSRKDFRKQDIIISSVIITETLYTVCEYPQKPENENCTILANDNKTCEVLPPESGYCVLPCNNGCSDIAIKQQTCTTDSRESCTEAIYDLGPCYRSDEGECPDFTIEIEDCESVDCQDLSLVLGNSTKNKVCPNPKVDLERCQGCIKMGIRITGSDAQDLLFSEENCFQITLDDNSCEAVITEETNCLRIVSGNSDECPLFSGMEENCQIVVVKENSLMFATPISCAIPEIESTTIPEEISTASSIITPEPTTITTDSTESSPTTPSTTDTPSGTEITTITDINTTIDTITTTAIEISTGKPSTETTEPSIPVTEAPTKPQTPPPTTEATTAMPETPVVTPTTGTTTTTATEESEENLLTPENLAVVTIAGTILSVIMSQANASLLQQLLQQLSQVIQNSQNNQNSDGNNSNNQNNGQNNQGNNQDNQNSAQNNIQNNNQDEDQDDDQDSDGDQSGSQGSNQDGDQDSDQGNGSGGSQGSQDTDGGDGGESSSVSQAGAAALIPNCDAGGYMSLVEELQGIVGQNTGKPLSPDAFNIVESINFCQHGGSGDAPEMVQDIAMTEGQLEPPPEWLGLSSPIDGVIRSKRRTNTEAHFGRHNRPHPPKYPSYFKPPVIEYGGWIPVTLPPYLQFSHRNKKPSLRHPTKATPERPTKGSSNRPKRFNQGERKLGIPKIQPKRSKIVLVITNDLYIPPVETTEEPLQQGLSTPSAESAPAGILQATESPVTTESTFSQMNETETLSSEVTSLNTTKSGIDTIDTNTDDQSQVASPVALGLVPAEEQEVEEEEEEEEEERGEETVGEEVSPEEVEDELEAVELERDIFFCGGTLISHKHILTAAHCVIPRKPNIIRLGETDFNTKNESRTVDYPVQRIAVNPGYRFPVKYNDIAIITLENAVPTQSGLVPSCVPTSELDLDEGQSATVSGWGIRANEEASDILIDVEVRVRSLQQCNNSYNTLGELFVLHYPNGLVSSMICASGDEGQDVCRGDSGGPLFLKENLQVAGVVSAGYGCGDVNFPGLYTRVDSFLTWMDLVVYGRCASPIR